MIYCDSSALLKLIFLEPETAELRQWLFARTDSPLTSSELARVEVLRGCRRVDESVLPAARALLADLELIPLSGRVIDTAGDLPDPLLRSLDALHLASALSIAPDLTAFIAYDRRLSAAAAEAGLNTVQPGA
ncbi:MAG: type II toxin-antitoxin system VapC family toxin [Nakamurella sp.]